MVIGSRDKGAGKVYSFVAFVKDAEGVEQIQRVFESDTLMDTHVGKGGVDAAINWLTKQSRSPQRLLVDIAGDERPLDTLDRLADYCEPSVEVYVVGDRNDVGLFRNLLARGVQDYLVKPLNANLVRRVTTHHGTTRSRHGKNIVVAGTRGGVGTTSVAAHLARSLAQGGTRRRVVYLDLNVYDGSGAGLLGRPGGTALLDVIANIHQLDQQYMERTLADAGDGLFVLAAEIEQSDEFAPEPNSLGQLLDVLAQYFHYVVTDLCWRGGVVVEKVADHADIYCVVADASVHSARTMARMVRHVQSRPGAPGMLGVLNHPQPQSAYRVHDKDFEQAVNTPIQLRIPYDAKGPARAENMATELNSHSDFAAGVRNLARHVTGESMHKGKRSLFRRLRPKVA